MIPDAKELDRGFHDVTLLDMADAVEPVVPVEDMWPAITSTWLSYGDARYRGVPTGRVLHRIVQITCDRSIRYLVC